MPLEAGLSMLQHPDRDVRRTAAHAVTAGLEPGLRTRGFIFNTLLLDKSVDDRLRHYPTWISERNLSNEASDESVQALIDAVVGRFDVKYEEVTSNCQDTGMVLARGELEIAKRKGSQVTVDIARMPIMTGTANKGGRVKAASKLGKTSIQGLDGRFSVAVRPTAPAQCDS